jgi:CRP-like cAMP-binding protein
MSKRQGMNELLETSKKILASGIEINYLGDEFLFRQGQKAEFVFYLQGGALLLDWPNENKRVTVIDKPIFIGIDEAMHGDKYACSAMTTKESTFLVFDRSYFNHLITEFDQAKSYFEAMHLDFVQQIKQLEIA